MDADVQIENVVVDVPLEAAAALQVTDTSPHAPTHALTHTHEISASEPVRASPLPDFASISTPHIPQIIENGAAPSPTRGEPRPRRSGEHGKLSGAPTPAITSHTVAERRKQLIEAFAAQHMTYTPANLRRLFRLLDVDNSKELSHAEFMEGLKALGFEHAQDPAAVSRVLAELDQDRTGRVGEKEFVEYFQRVHRSELQEKLTTYARHQIIITVTRYSADPSVPHPLDRSRPMGRYFKQEMTPPQFGDFLAQEYSAAPPADPTVPQSDEASAMRRHPAIRYWIDIVGYDPTVMGLICTHLGVHPQSINDAHMFQRQKVEMTPAQTQEASAPAVSSPPAPPSAEDAAAEQNMVAAAQAAGLPAGTITALIVANRTISSRRLPSGVLASEARPRRGSISTLLGTQATLEPRSRRASAHRVPTGAGDEARSPVASEAASVMSGFDRMSPTQHSPPMPSSPVNAEPLPPPIALRRGMSAMTAANVEELVEPSDIAVAARARHRVQILVHAMSLSNSPLQRPSFRRDAMYYMDMLGCGCWRRCSCVFTGCGRQNLLPLAPRGHKTASVKMARDLAATLARATGSTESAELTARPVAATDGVLSPRLGGMIAASKYTKATLQAQDTFDDDPTTLAGVESTRNVDACGCGRCGSGWCCKLLCGCGRCGQSGNAADSATARALELVPATVLQRDPPDIALEQVSVIVVDDSTLLTLRAPASKSARSGAAATTASGAAVHRWDQESVISILFSGLRGRLRMSTAESSFLHAASSRALACEVVDAISQFNFNLRDALIDWQTALETSIQRAASPLHTPHLYSFAKVADMYRRQLLPLATALEEVVRGSAVPVGAPAAAGTAALASEPVPVSGAAAAVAAAAASMTLTTYFADEAVLVNELKEDVAAICADVRGVADTVQNLKALHASLQSDQMNRVLYVLTLVTTLSLPATICTGYFGMNFDFSSLDGGGGAGVFWVALTILMVLFAFAYWAFGFFKYIG